MLETVHLSGYRLIRARKTSRSFFTTRVGVAILLDGERFLEKRRALLILLDGPKVPGKNIRSFFNFLFLLTRFLLNYPLSLPRPTPFTREPLPDPNRYSRRPDKRNDYKIVIGLFSVL